MIDSHREITLILKDFVPVRENLLPILQEINRQLHYLSEDAMKETASYLNISNAEVYGVATFYSFVDTEKRGRHIIRICQTISCDMKGKEKIIEAVEKKLGISMGETTADDRFTLLKANCIGWCHKSPAMIIDDKVYTELTADKASEVLDQWL